VRAARASCADSHRGTSERHRIAPPRLPARPLAHAVSSLERRGRLGDLRPRSARRRAVDHVPVHRDAAAARRDDGLKRWRAELPGSTRARSIQSRGDASRGLACLGIAEGRQNLGEIRNRRNRAFGSFARQRATACAIGAGQRVPRPRIRTPRGRDSRSSKPSLRTGTFKPLVRDRRDEISGPLFDRRPNNLGVRQLRIAPRSPVQEWTCREVGRNVPARADRSRHCSASVIQIRTDHAPLRSKTACITASDVACSRTR
jgi:hypothetical protein